MKNTLTEKQLYGTWLDIRLALEDMEILIDMSVDALKQYRKDKRKCESLLKKSAEHYKELNGKYPK